MEAIIMQRTQLRFPDDLYDKATVLAAIHHASFNQFVVDLLTEKVASWEADRGEIPTLQKQEN
jgi:predicted HicB family RNase H-like nuclease